MRLNWRVVGYIITLNARGYDWVVMGDMNMDSAAFNADHWIQSVRGFPLASCLPTCPEELSWHVHRPDGRVPRPPHEGRPHAGRAARRRAVC